MNGDTTTDVLTGAAARKKVRAGVNAVYNAVKLTLGPEGMNALLPRSFNRGPRLTNDGVTVSENVRPSDEHERLAADFFKEGSKKTNELAGDGTTTTAVIAGFLINQIFDELQYEETPSASLLSKEGSSKKGVRGIRKELKDLKDQVIAKIKERATKIESLEDLEKIAVISVGKEDQEVAHRIAAMVWQVGRDAEGLFVDNHIDVVEGYKGEVETEVTLGMRFPAKVAHRAFVNKPERFEMVIEDSKVIITNHRLEDPHQIVALLNRLQLPKVAVFAPHFSAGVLTAFLNSAKNGVFCFPVFSPALRTDQLEDLGAYTGATVIDKDKGDKLHTIAPTALGHADKITVKDVETREDAVLMGGGGAKTDRVKERIEILKGQLSESKNDMTRIQLEKRIANLQAAVGVIRVGASTNAELLYLKLKIEDGVFACKAALQEGYVKGGGLCLREIADEMDENILTNTLKAPYEQIQRNAGGFLEIGDEVIDPARVVRLEIEHGVSVASSIITTGISIPERRERTQADGLEMVARAIAKGVFYDAKHRGLIKENEDEASADQEKGFEKAMFDANRD